MVEARGRQPEAKTARVYCVVPRELAPKLHEVLRKHFRDDPAVEVVVERREAARRDGDDRRKAKGPAAEAPGTERRVTRSAGGRRAGERRAPLTEAPPRELPRKARPHADRIRFLQRLEPSQLEQEDADTARLVARAQTGDDDAFSTVYTRYFDRVYNYLRVALDDPDEAEDKTQQTFLNAYEALPRYRPRGPFRAWLFTVARNLAVDHLREHGRIVVEDPEQIDRRREAAAPAEDELPEIDINVLGWISDPELLMLFERLPLVQRQVLVLRHLLDLTNTEIAKTLDITPNHVGVLHHRAIGFLRERLVALGRPAPPQRDDPSRMRTYKRQAIVLRRRRFSLLKR